MGLAEIIIAKHRNGAVGDVRLRFKSEFAKFMNIEDDVELQEVRSRLNQGAPQTAAPPTPDFLQPSGNDQAPF